MGQSSSVPVGGRGGRRKSLRDSFRSPFPRRSQTHQGPLSATFNFVDIDLKVDQLNVNTATEEELMTLPGVTRAIAQNIVEYRQAIGRFKKVEDLALVSGIGAEKLDLIRPEICVNRRKNVSCTSSRAQSFDSLASTDQNYGRLGIKSSPHSRPINVNSASVFELMTVHGLNQELAANVVHHRDRRGPFRTIEDLVKVKGINQWRLGAVRSQLLVEDPPNDMSDGTQLNIPLQSHSPYVANGKISGHRKTLSAPAKCNNLTNGFLPGKDIFELLSAYSQRPIVEEDFHYERNGKHALRVASWNLHDMSLEKAENPGVREIICRTVLENRLSLIAVQEVVDAIALQKICDELNNPTLRRVADWKENQRKWKHCLPDNVDSLSKKCRSLGFLYDSACNVELSALKELCVTLRDPIALPTVEAILATFKLRDLNVSLLNVYLPNHDVSCIDGIEKWLRGHLKQTDMLVILGDFTGLAQNKEEEEMDRLQYKSVVPMSTSTGSCNSQHFRDNILLNSETQLQYTGVSGVVRQGLNHLAIPRGWVWGGPASEHCPIWCELYTEPLLAEKDAILANGGAILE